MTRLILIVSVVALIIIVSIASEYPPAYDYDEEWTDTPPSDLSGAWDEDHVYLSWDKAYDIYENDVDGYRLYRAPDEDSDYVMINITDEIDNDDDGETDEEYELITTLDYTDSASALTAAGIYLLVPFYYKITAAVVVAIDSTYRLYESDYSGPVELMKWPVSECFVATAVFDSSSANQVRILSSFRDEALMGTKIGKWIVKRYYRMSPPIADFIGEKPLLKLFVRLHLKLVIGLLRLMKALDSLQGPVNEKGFSL